MKVYKNFEQFKRLEKAIVTTGTFDGVHIGHKEIIKKLKDQAALEKGESVIFTFDPHPRHILYPHDNSLSLLNTLEEKIELLAEQGIDHLIVHPFTKSFSNISSLEYVRDLLVNNIGLKTMVIGYDHRFGKNREGDIELLKEYGSIYDFKIQEIEVQLIDNINVSSTKIRKALLEGEIKTATQYLGYFYRLSGTVIHGDKKGRTIGFPTANLKINDPLKLIPKNGVYAVNAWHNGAMHKGMANIGSRPTINDKEEQRIEVHLIDFSGDLYGKNLKIEITQHIRTQRKFESLEALKQQLVLDKIAALNVDH